MPHEYFLANGYVATASEPGAYWGMSEMRLRNLASREARVRQRLYFADREPVDLAERVIGPLGGPYQEFPRDLPAELGNAGPWGARIRSDAPLAFVHISLARRNGRRQERQFAGGCAFQLARPQLARRWVFPDCFKMFVPPQNPPFPFSQYEWYHFLNPHPTPTRLRLTIGDDRGGRDVREHTLGAERVWFLDDPALVRGDFGQCYLEVVSDQPILADGARVLQSPLGPDDWGVVIGCASPPSSETDPTDPARVP